MSSGVTRTAFIDAMTTMGLMDQMCTYQHSSRPVLSL